MKASQNIDQNSLSNGYDEILELIQAKEKRDFITIIKVS
jgi:hypothetical protein